MSLLRGVRASLSLGCRGLLGLRHRFVSGSSAPLLAIGGSFRSPAIPLLHYGASTPAAVRAFATSIGGEPLVGHQAPDFEADALMPSGQVEKVSLMSLLEQYDGVCLLFYPLDFSFVCPTELLAYNDKAEEFKEKNWAFLAVSVDSVFAHGAWCRLSPSEGGVGRLSFPLVSDITKKISRSYGLLLKETAALRGCVLIDKQGLVRQMTVNDMGLGRNVEETLRGIDMIIHLTNNKTKVCPAGWIKGKQALSATQDAVKDYLKSLNK